MWAPDPSNGFSLEPMYCKIQEQRILKIKTIHIHKHEKKIPDTMEAILKHWQVCSHLIGYELLI